MKRKHLGSKFEHFLAEEGILEECRATAIRARRAQDSRATTLTILAIGNLTRAEFVDVRLALVAAGADFVVTPADAARCLAKQEFSPELIVVAQSWPGQFTDDEIAKLRRLAPLARVWYASGSWCEGEQRTGQPVAGTLRGYWHHWPARLARELDKAEEDRSPTWGLPITASDDERLLATVPINDAPQTSSRELVVVCAASFEAANALADACDAAGYATVATVREVDIAARGAAAVLWDTEADAAGDPARVARLRGAAGGAPAVALLNFPRAEDRTAALAAGVAAVVSKPTMIADLLWALDHVGRPESRVSG